VLHVCIYATPCHSCRIQKNTQVKHTQIKYNSQMQTMQNTAKQNYPCSVSSYDTQPAQCATIWTRVLSESMRYHGRNNTGLDWTDWHCKLVDRQTRETTDCLTSSKISQTRYGGPLSATNVLNDIESKTLAVNSSSTRFRWPRKFAWIASNNAPTSQCCCYKVTPSAQASLPSVLVNNYPLTQR